MNTSKQVNIMVVLIFLSVLATGAYTLWDPVRAKDAESVQLDKEVERGAWLFSQNCRVCHGNKGEGGSAANRLAAAPALNTPRLQGIDDTGKVDATERGIQFKRVFDTITCGRVGRAMPNWGQSQGGPLNAEQIKQLARFITAGGNEGWAKAEEFALEGVPLYDRHGDLDSPLRLAQALDGSSSQVFINTIDPLGPGIRLQVGDELMSVSAVDKATTSVTVERGLGTTEPAPHDVGAQVLTPPVPPASPVLTGNTCGQNPPAPVRETPTAAGGSPVPTATPPAGAQQLTIAAINITLSTKTLTAQAGSPITITFDNQEAVQHNFAVFRGADNTGELLGATDFADGPIQQTLTIGPLEAGSYYYLCEIHPDQMNGTLTVQ